MTKSWIKDNWDFLTARGVKYLEYVEDLFQQKDILTTARFFGKVAVLNNVGGLFAKFPDKDSEAGMLFLRPYIIADMPDGIEAVYIDPKRYIFNEEGRITGLKSAYEHTVFAVRG